MTDELRIGDAERDAVVVALHDHFAAGRLDRAELDGRMDAALAAKTRGDLAALVRDLPPPHGLPEAARARPAPVPGPGPAPWGRPGPMYGGPHHPRHRHRHHMHPHHHGPPGPAFPLLLAVFLVLTFTVGAGTGLLAVLGIAMVAWLARAARLAASVRRS
ncbi:DUF1707 domain-containing protein [Actinomadura sp. WMMB 499]|uniref:DUF1707 SHOCT-like domain-containing protein n=1 Tax=Actinomadura sp. WMMB 499 TaxID=1219491 RepID=UPI001246D6F6|nr:DUF1707 domain-containing protein [Actinomadura sp. WMMB 499]QFG20775.1 DUF1707 domain-containing protein [Actinomadura sp. WMMB 499]